MGTGKRVDPGGFSFSKKTRRGLESGKFSLMGGNRAIAVDRSGRTVEIAKSRLLKSAAVSTPPRPKADLLEGTLAAAQIAEALWPFAQRVLAMGRRYWETRATRRAPFPQAAGPSEGGPSLRWHRGTRLPAALGHPRQPGTSDLEKLTEHVTPGCNDLPL